MYFGSFLQGHMDGSGTFVDTNCQAYKVTYEAGKEVRREVNEL